MKVYIDVVFFINIFFDLILLLSVDILLKRKTKFHNLVFGSLIGGCSTFLLFTTISSITLFFFKIIISILMSITTFNYKNMKYTIKNILYLYLVSIFLGGFLYFINNQLSYRQNGLVFFHNGLSINIILILIISPLILYFYIKQNKDLKNNYNNYYYLDIYINNSVIHSISYLDTGNKLIDPYTLKPVILLYNKSPVFDNIPYTLIPYNTITSKGYIKGYKADIDIKGVGRRKKVIIGLINNKIGIDGVDAILNTTILEGK